MKCPYRGFEECLLEQCPSCIYKEIKERKIAGTYSVALGVDSGIRNNTAWEYIDTKYEFVACKLMDNNVQPIPPEEVTVNNTTNTKINTVLKKSIF